MHPILVAGTGSWKDKNDADWYCPGHPFGKFLEGAGVGATYDRDKPFIWSTDLGGMPWTGDKDWAAGGAALNYFVRYATKTFGAVTTNMPVRACETALIVHSHGLQVAAFAAHEHDLKVDVLVSFGSPIRNDLAPRYAALRKNTRFWLHFYSDKTDKWQKLGELFDGGWKRWLPGGDSRFVGACPYADRNEFVPRVGHSELLRDPQHYHILVERGLVTALKG